MSFFFSEKFVKRKVVCANFFCGGFFFLPKQVRTKFQQSFEEDGQRKEKIYKKQR
jgi:hypothetical protein